MFHCARQLTGPVLVTATTHLSIDQLSLADQHFFVDRLNLEGLEREIPPGITLLTGSVENNSNRALGVSVEWLARMRVLAE